MALHVLLSFAHVSLTRMNQIVHPFTVKAVVLNLSELRKFFLLLGSQMIAFLVYWFVPIKDFPLVGICFVLWGFVRLSSYWVAILKAFMILNKTMRNSVFCGGGIKILTRPFLFSFLHNPFFISFCITLSHLHTCFAVFTDF